MLPSRFASSSAVRRVMSAAARFHYNTVQPYEPPSWAKALRYQPTAYVKVL